MVKHIWDMRWPVGKGKVVGHFMCAQRENLHAHFSMDILRVTGCSKHLYNKCKVGEMLVCRTDFSF